MSATQITGGSVKYTEPSNYSTGKTGCEVTIHFTVADGDGQMAPVMGDTAYCEAMRLATGKLSLGGPLAQTQPSALVESPPTTAAQPQPAPAATAAPTIGGASTVIGQPVEIGTSHGPTAQTLASPSEVVIGGPSPGTVVTPPSAILPEGIVIGHRHPAPNGASSGVVIGVAAPEPGGGITDLDLRKGVEQFLARLEPGKDADPVARQRGPVLLRQSLYEFVAPPAKVYALSQDQRVPFLEKLAALT